MAIKLDNDRWACSICGEIYGQSSRADNCRDSHNMLYIPISKDELNRLINAIVLEQFDMIPPSVLRTLQKYARLQIIKEAQDGKI